MAEMTTAVFKIPYSGSYPSDNFTWKRVCEFYDQPGPGYRVDPTVIQILLGFVQRVYPEANDESILKYENKYFTVIGERDFGEYMFIYRHDSKWMIGAVTVNDYEKAARGKYYYTAPPEDLPRC
jgi:hypothetical protein